MNHFELQKKAQVANHLGDQSIVLALNQPESHEQLKKHTVLS